MALDWNTFFNRPRNYVEQNQPLLVSPGNSQEDMFLKLFQQLLAPQTRSTSSGLDFTRLLQALKEPEPTPHYGLGGALITANNPTGTRSSLTPEDEWRRMFPR